MIVETKYGEWLRQAAKLVGLSEDRVGDADVFGCPTAVGAWRDGWHPRDFAAQLLDMSAVFASDKGCPFKNMTAADIRGRLGALPQREPITHECHSTGGAYDECQTNIRFQRGDVLVIRGERVVGVADTWPIAVTKEQGKLHSIKLDTPPKRWAADETFGDPRLLVGWKLAVAKAQALGLELNEHATKHLQEA